MTIQPARTIAVAAAAASAVLYVLIGFGVLEIGTSKSGTNDLLAFGLMVGAVFAVIAIVVASVSRTWVLALVAIVDAIVIVGYFALAGVREPPIEPWGLLVKSAQLVLLVGLGYLLVHRRVASRGGTATAI